jgi:hypothetical protein
VVADGPAIYGMARIVSRSRRGTRGAGYGWLLVIAGTAVSIAGNVAHAQPGLVARGIAAAIPLAVLAMLEGLKGDAREVVRLATPDPSREAVHNQGRPDGAAWTARTLAQAAGCGRSTAAAFLAAHRAQHREGGPR